MDAAHTVTAHPAAHPGHPLVLLWLAVVFCVVATPLVLALRFRAIRRAELRRCPVCGSTAVRAATHEPVASLDVRVGVQCGQCGAWRRLTTFREHHEAQARAVARDLRRLEGDARRLAAAEQRRFAAALRADVVGADDFLARSRERRRLPRGG